ncbi:hypothetical protein LXL04_014312 [Taraxacum kok-saghyz]
MSLAIDVYHKGCFVPNPFYYANPDKESVTGVEVSNMEFKEFMTYLRSHEFLELHVAYLYPRNRFFIRISIIERIRNKATFVVNINCKRHCKWKACAISISPPLRISKIRVSMDMSSAIPQDILQPLTDLEKPTDVKVFDLFEMVADVADDVADDVAGDVADDMAVVVVHMDDVANDVDYMCHKVMCR